MNKKSIIITVTSAATMLLCSIGMSTIHAGSDESAVRLKNVILLCNDTGNTAEYDANGDKSVDILDLCVKKRNILYKSYAEFQLNDAAVNYNERTVKIPVYVRNTSANVVSTSMKVNYDHQKFDLVEVNTYGKGIWTVAEDIICFNGDRNTNITGNESVAYLLFRIKTDLPSSSYQFSLSDISSYVTCESGSNRKLLTDECPEKSEIRYVNINEIITTTVPVTTEPPVVVTTPAVTTQTQPASEDLSELTGEESKLIELINEYRREKNLPVMSASMAICRAARERSEELAVNFSDQRPNGANLESLLEKYGVYSSTNGSFSTATFTSASKVIEIMKKNTLYNFESCKKLGVGYTYIPNSTYKHYWTILWSY